ncbi:hypothetical protein QTP81_09740 [Alteromonas sp. ASW11-36]|uniref:Photosynthesis system II assembly factor Ycf48/Hcf136-like domain-containing protein n=1 Tax=Alteromonas arenosi TaxID=3055817 RepID=A0ABT7SXF6_9ALTE|nr:hypothetical protein [Alteromonas sp. ASW11-36]MDM7860876.1 hypothetical protein [Alteromonas sp. ASW11-36]
MTQRKRLLASFLIPLSFAVGAETFQAPLVEKSLLLDADTDQYHVVVGERGHVVISELDSQDFTQLSLPLAVTLTAVDVLGDHIWVAGHDATIMHSPDRGATWEIQMNEPDMERPFLDILFFNDTHGIAVGAYGLFYRTRDGGQSWNAEQHATLLNPIDIEYLEEIRAEDESFYLEELNSILPHINRIVYANGKVYAAGETGLLAVSENLGESWGRDELDYFGSFFDFQPVDDSRNVAIGLRGAVYTQVDKGDWQRVNSCTTSTLNSVKLLDNGQLLVVGNNGAIIHIDVDTLFSGTVNNCSTNGMRITQLESKSAIATVFKNNNSYTAVTSDGLLPLTSK